MKNKNQKYKKNIMSNIKKKPRNTKNFWCKCLKYFLYTLLIILLLIPCFLGLYGGFQLIVSNYISNK